jgi:hypothetical protein
MSFKSTVGTFFLMLSIVGASVIGSSAQTQSVERPSLPKRGSENYRLMMDEFADSAVHVAYAKRFVQVHEGSLTGRQCQQYSHILAAYAGQMATVTRAGVSPQSEFWNDVRAYSIGMIGAPGVVIPGRKTSEYWVTTGSESEDRELRRIVSLEIDEARSQLIRTAGYSPSAIDGNCRTAPQELTTQAER